MEAATPLRQAQVRTVGDRLMVDGLVVEDDCAVRLVRAHQPLANQHDGTTCGLVNLYQVDPFLA